MSFIEDELRRNRVLLGRRSVSGKSFVTFLTTSEEVASPNIYLCLSFAGCHQFEAIYHARKPVYSLPFQNPMLEIDTILQWHAFSISYGTADVCVINHLANTS